MRVIAVIVVAACSAQPRPISPLAGTGSGVVELELVRREWPLPQEPATGERRPDDLPLILISGVGPGPAKAISQADRDALAARAKTARGVERIALLYQYAAALEAESEADFDNASKLTTAALAYDVVVSEPDLEKFAKADEALFRAAMVMWRDGEHYSVAGSAALLHRLVDKLPKSALVDDALVALADNEDDPARAEKLYERALTIATGPLLEYARIKLGITQQKLGDDVKSLSLLADVAMHASSDAIRETAARSAIHAFAVVGKPETAHSFFSRIDPGHAIEHMRRLVWAYLDLGKHPAALAAANATLQLDLDPNAICYEHIAIVSAYASSNQRKLAIGAAGELVDAAHRAGPKCKADAEAVLCMLAYLWQRELPKSEADPELVMDLWDVAIRIDATPEVRAIALFDRAILAWQRAEIDRTAAHWRRAADAMRDAGQPDAAADARSNADLVERSSPRRLRRRCAVRQSRTLRVRRR